METLAEVLFAIACVLPVLGYALSSKHGWRFWRIWTGDSVSFREEDANA